jgi:hypothetical protein
MGASSGRNKQNSQKIIGHGEVTSRVLFKLCIACLRPKTLRRITHRLEAVQSQTGFLPRGMMAVIFCTGTLSVDSNGFRVEKCPFLVFWTLCLTFVDLWP